MCVTIVGFLRSIASAQFHAGVDIAARTAVAPDTTS